MKALLIFEYRDGKLLDSSYELTAFNRLLGADCAALLIGDEANAPRFDGRVYLADVSRLGEYAPDLHSQAVLAAVERESPDYVVFLHSSYGWDLAPRVAAGLDTCMIPEVIGINDDGFEVGCCNAKMRRTVKPSNLPAVLTVQAGAFSPEGEPAGTPVIERLDVDGTPLVEFLGYEPAEAKAVDLTKAEVIVCAGRGIGKKDNMALVTALAETLGGEVGATRPVVDSGWVDHSLQVGTTGQMVNPRLYVGCGISGAVQHLVGMKNADFIVAVNTDKNAPITEAADVLVVADVVQFLPALTARLKQ